MTEREEMLYRVNMYYFAMLDTALYLDSHPQSKVALDYFHRNQKMLQQAKAAYEDKYGALSKDSVRNDQYWEWIDDPWPWEGVDD